MPEAAPTTVRWFALPLLALGAAGFAAFWVLLALLLGRQCAWLAPLAALDIALLQGLARWPHGAGRALAATLATALTVALANYMIAAGQIGMGFGLRPGESALLMGADYAWLLVTLANSRADLVWYAAGIALAAWTGLRRRRAP
ncbi:hypothetical protein [Thermomonas sp.]|uniref:hypothetical protein n=1 Tax=Thermomonas sp. TaxID=1971895 RepID=UPI001D56BA87|nr:hypothetical protein [Thermomonas sp.]MBZ0087348.1 hypothetical protein [Thermomonas sp.]HRO63041.1 hypothetical protein [Thermomonas sp.]